MVPRLEGSSAQVDDPRRAAHRGGTLSMRIPVSLRLILLLTVACHGRTDPLICTAVAEPAVVVELRDAVTLAPIVGATAILSEGAYSETMFEGPDALYSGGFERPGTYQVDITATGFAAVTRAGITAPAGPCGPVTQNVTIDMQPNPAPAFLIREATPGSWQMIPGRLLVR